MILISREQSGHGRNRSAPARAGVTFPSQVVGRNCTARSLSTVCRCADVTTLLASPAHRIRLLKYAFSTAERGLSWRACQASVRDGVRYRQFVVHEIVVTSVSRATGSASRRPWQEWPRQDTQMCRYGSMDGGIWAAVALSGVLVAAVGTTARVLGFGSIVVSTLGDSHHRERSTRLQWTCRDCLYVFDSVDVCGDDGRCLLPQVCGQQGSAARGVQHQRRRVFHVVGGHRVHGTARTTTTGAVPTDDHVSSSFLTASACACVGALVWAALRLGEAVTRVVDVTMTVLQWSHDRHVV